MNLLPKHTLFDLDSFLPSHFWEPQSWSGGKSKDGTFPPRIDVEENKSGYRVSAELPGVDKKDLHVSIEDGVLKIEAELESEDKEEKDGRIIRSERHYGKFLRQFSVGKDIQESDIKAEFKNGLLKIDLPKPNDLKSEARKISIS